MVGGGSQYAGGGGGYTKTYKNDTSGYRDGGAVLVSYGEVVQIIVGAGGNGSSSGGGSQGGYSQFKDGSYRANGGYPSTPPSYPVNGGNGGSGGSAYGNTSTKNYRGVDGGNGKGSTVSGYGSSNGGTGQGHTTREFGEPNGQIYAYGGYAISGSFREEVEPNTGNGGNGDGLGGNNGADGIVLIRYYAYG